MQPNNSVKRFLEVIPTIYYLVNILSVYYSESNILLIGTDKGLNYLDLSNEEFSVVGVKKYVNFGIDKVDKDIFIFTDSGIFKKTGNKINLFISSNYPKRVLGNGEDLLFWTKGGERILYNGKSIVLNNFVNDVSLSRDREYIISTSNGLFNVSSRKLAAKKSNFNVAKKQQIHLKNFYQDDRSNNIDLSDFESYAFYEKRFLVYRVGSW